MQLFLDCLPCLHRQVLEAARQTTSDVSVQARIMDRAATTLTHRSDYATAPAMAEAMHSIVREETGAVDPYRAVKDRDMTAALALEPMLWGYAATGDDPLRTALKVAATGNVMDSAIYSDLDIAACVTAELDRPFARCDVDALAADLESARTVLVIGDNAGETVFDKILLAQLGEGRDVTYAVRGRPIINDATLDDARFTGVDQHAALISSGCPAPGTVLETCTDEFLELFRSADVVISKGQGNFESLSAVARSIYFLLKAKCAMVADDLNTAVGDYVFLKR